LDGVDVPKNFSVGTTLQPRVTQVLDLQPDLESVLAAMHQKTRYNIRLAEKKGVTVRWSTDDDDLDIFLQLITSTYTRQGIRLHPTAYYRAMWQHLKKVEMVELGIAEIAGRPLAANMVIWHDQTATYLHGGSSDQEKHLMAPYLLQWSTMQRAFTRGVTMYDFWGIAPNDNPTHQWAGVTRFKKGFGGRVVTFPPALNAILQPAWYQAYRLAKRMRGGVDA
jgi:lipid II:glycine glycyltransferase (peptidoglycan interpeptide bridge formation enzyme)